MRPFPWPQRLREAARALTVEVPGFAAARSVDLEPVVATASLERADALVLSLDLRPNVRGIAGQLPERNLRNRAWWFEPSASAGPAFTWMNPSTVGLGPAGAARAIDLSVDGRIDLHVWRDSARLVITPSAGSD